MQNASSSFLTRPESQIGRAHPHVENFPAILWKNLAAMVAKHTAALRKLEKVLQL
jgi:hypothetical protein